MPSSAQGRGIGLYLVASILLAVVPLLAIAGVLVARQQALQRETFEQTLLESSRALSLAVDRQLASYQVMLETLAESEVLRHDDFPALYEIARRVANRNGAVFISCFDAAGRQIFNTIRPVGENLPTPFKDAPGPADGTRPPTGDDYSLKHVLETGRPAVSDLFLGLVAGRYIFTVNVPVFRDGKVAYVLNAAFGPDVMTHLLDRQFRGTPAVIFDRRGFIVGRWLNADRYIGSQVQPKQLALARAHELGVELGTTLEGIALYYSYARSPATGWTVAMGIERATLERDLRAGWIISGLLALGGLAFGVGLALLLASRLRRSITDLARAATTNTSPRVHGLRTREVADLERALQNAAAARDAQAAERESRLVAETRKAEAEEASRSKDRFIAVLSHELRNPLAPIRNSINLLRTIRQDDEAVRDVVDTLDRQSEHLTRLVSDLLDVSRINSGKIVLQREPVDLRKIAQHAIEAARPAIESHRHQLIDDIPAEPVCVHGDFARLSQVVSNLLDNAVKFTPAGGSVELSLASNQAEAVLRVRDNGRGIDPEQLPRLFSAFHIDDVARYRLEGGLGLGLALAKSLVELHGGSLEATSDGPNKGSEFIVRLPRVDCPHITSRADAQHTALLESPPEQRAAAATLARRVLVVDDNVDAAVSTAALVQLLGHETRVAHDGMTALDIAAAFRPEIVLLDIGMPGLDGYEVAKRLRQRHTERLILVAITGWGQEADRQRSRAAGFDVHLVKPVELEALQAVLDRQC